MRASLALDPAEASSERSKTALDPSPRQEGGQRVGLKTFLFSIVYYLHGHWWAEPDYAVAVPFGSGSLGRNPSQAHAKLSL